MENLIETSNLTKYYGSLMAVDHVSFKIGEGEVFGFLGPNGAGKTTIIKMLVGLTSPSEGTASIAGYDIRKNIVEVKRRIGVVPETSNLYNELSTWENLLFSSRLYHVPKVERAKRIQDLIEKFNLEERRNVKFGKLSKGLKRRVIIASALIHQPEVVFMDEPTSGLDVVSAHSLRRLIGDLRREGTTVFLTTHYIEEADQLCDRIAILVEGKIRTIDTPRRIKDSIVVSPVIDVLLTREPEKSFVEKLSGFGRVELNGRRITIESEQIGETLVSFIELAVEYQIQIEKVNTVQPSLEDAFVKLTGVSSEAMKIDKEGGRH